MHFGLHSIIISAPLSKKSSNVAVEEVRMVAIGEGFLQSPAVKLSQGPCREETKGHQGPPLGRLWGDASNICEEGSIEEDRRQVLS